MPPADTVLFIPTEKELHKIFNLKAKVFDNDFMAGIYQNIPIIVTGIGKANAAITATLFFSKYGTSLKTALIGICGAYHSSGCAVGEIVSVKYDYFVDECVYDGEKITALSEKNMPICNMDRVEFLTVNGLHQVNSNTVSFIPATDKISELYRRKTNADTENMEGAAFGLAAARVGAKTYQIRAVSNYCGNLENQNWNINKASENLKKTVDSFLCELAT